MRTFDYEADIGPVRHERLRMERMQKAASETPGKDGWIYKLFLFQSFEGIGKEM